MLTSLSASANLTLIWFPRYQCLSPFLVTRSRRALIWLNRALLSGYHRDKERSPHHGAQSGEHPEELGLAKVDVLWEWKDLVSRLFSWPLSSTSIQLPRPDSLCLCFNNFFNFCSFSHCSALFLCLLFKFLRVEFD